MSIFGALDTSVSGLQSQSSAFTNISDNIANSQTVGYKGVDTNFVNYLVQSTATSNGSDSVVADPSYTNTVQGTVTQSNDPLALAISGQGYFNVSDAAATTAKSTSGGLSFQAQQYYTRAGDFTLDKQGYLVNGSNAYLDGWKVNPATGAVDTSVLAPIQIAQGSSPPVATSTITLAAALPTTPAQGQPVSTNVDVYDSVGTMQQVNLNWTQSTTNANQWTLALSSPGANPAAIGSATMTFGPTGTVTSAAAGTLSSLTGSGGVTASANTANGAASLSFAPNFGNGAQPIALDLGSFGSTSGLTEYAGTSLNLQGATQDGMPQGSFSNVAIDQQGNVAVSYSNGFSQTVAQIPIATFAAPDALQNQSGQMYTSSQGSGSATVNAVGSNGSGSLVTGSVESSNVDIATEFTKLITAQEAYSANSKVVTTAQQLLQTTVNMVQ